MIHLYIIVVILTLVTKTGAVSRRAKIHTAISARRQLCRVQKERDFIG